MFLYRTLRHALKLGLELYYVDIQAVGQERVPESGPVMFAANHPNSIMDTVVLGAQTNRSISYLARSGLFKNPLMALLFRQCGVIPVYRAQDGPIAKGSNESAFRAAFDVLRKGGTIGIFPEGQNAPERQVRDIKTGTARIALGAEAEEDFGLGVKIVPVGLNFTDRDRYLTRVLVRFGEPIDARDFASAYRADERSAVRELTDAIQQGIREQAVHITDGRHTQLVSDVNAVYGRKLLDELRGRLPDVRRLDQKLYDSMRAVRSGQDLDGYFEAKQRIADAAAHFQKADPEALYRISRRLRRYKDHLAQANLRADFVDRPPKTLRVRSEAIKMSLYAIVLAPIALYGALHNYIPARLTRRAILRAPDEAIRAITALVAGGLIFGAFYAGYGTAMYLATASIPQTAAYLITLPAAGMWFRRYRRQLARYSGRILVRNLFKTKRWMLRQLIIEREQLILELDSLRDRYLANVRSEISR